MIRTAASPMQKTVKSGAVFQSWKLMTKKLYLHLRTPAARTGYNEGFAFQGKGSRQSGLSRNSPILHSLKGDWCGENLTVSIKPMDPLHPTPLTWDCPKVEPHVGHQN